MGCPRHNDFLEVMFNKAILNSNYVNVYAGVAYNRDQGFIVYRTIINKRGL